MKTLFYYFPLLVILSLFFACSSDSEEIVEDEIKELKLSVTGDITTENVDFEFEILDGNGEYKAVVSEIDGDPDAKVTIKGNEVTVNLLSHLSAEITITDKKNKKATVHVESTHESLQTIPNYGIFLDEGQTSIINDFIKFGAGAPYTFEKIRGNASKIVTENDEMKVTSLGLGDTYYKVRDKRGSVARLRVQTSLDFDMSLESNYLEITGINNLSATVTLDWGTGWEIIGSTNNVTENLSVSRVLISTGVWSDYYVLFIHTVDEGKGTDTITLKNKEGDLAAVKVKVR